MVPPVMDAVQRVNAESSRVSAGLFRFLETSSDLIAVFGPDLRHVYANEAVCRLMKLPRELILGRRYDELAMSPVNAQRMQTAIARVFQTGEPQRIEVRGHHRVTGAQTVFDVAYSAELSADGAVELVIGVSRDVSALRFAEERSRASAERLSIILESGGVAIIGVDHEARLRFMNRLAEAELVAANAGLAPAIGEPLARFVPPTVMPEIMASIAMVLETGAPFAEELDLEIAGAIRRFGVQVRPERSEQGLVQGAVIVARDVTLERQREAQLHLSERLASLGRIAAGVAHEIANPLSSVYGNLEMVRHELARLGRDQLALEPLMRELGEMLTDAHEGAERIRHIIEDIGHMVRPDATLNARIDLEDITRTVARMLDATVRQRARLTLALEHVPLIAGSRPRLAQVVSNLIQNSLLAMPAERPPSDNLIAVSLRRDAGHLELVVRDNGVGIATEVKPRVFDPFFTTRPVGAGMGLGLTVAHGIVTSHRGTLTLESEPGSGTVATIRLPLIDEE